MANKLLFSLSMVGLAYLIRKYYFLAETPSPVVKIQFGDLRGLTVKTRDGRGYFAYEGIPYAKPPLGDLRYEPPEPWTAKWVGVRHVKETGPVCIQFDGFFKTISGAEDCLHLNVYTPKVQNAKLPVMFWIHGGHFNFGSADMYRPDYLLDKDVVLVTVNYRLNSFGFLNTGNDGVVKGNMGLKDQTMALKWVRDNIHHFGGDPSQVTIFGESAGGGSVHFHMLSPQSKGLFSKAILQSGTALNPWALNPVASKQAVRFAQRAGCPTKPTSSMVTCLRGKEAGELARLHEEQSDRISSHLRMFVPTLEPEGPSAFISRDPRKIIASGDFNKVPFLAGVNSAEGLLLSAPMVANRTLRSLLKADWVKNLGAMLYFPEGGVSKAQGQEIMKHYLPGGEVSLDDPLSQLPAFTHLISDWVWNVGFHEAIHAHGKDPKGPPMFIYYYTYEGDFSLDAMLMAVKGDYHPLIEILWMKLDTWFRRDVLGEVIPRYGPCHGDELALLFELKGLASVPKGGKDYVMSKAFIDSIYTFVSRKELNSGLEFKGKKWTPVPPGLKDSEDLKYMKIDSQSPGMVVEPFKENIKFWKKLNLTLLI